jgi:hypothetical protein
VLFKVTLEAAKVTDVAAPIQAKSMLLPALSPNELLIVMVTAPDVVSIVTSLPLSELVGVSDEEVKERSV